MEDHKVVPVYLPEREVVRLCDFCLTPRPAWMYPLLDHASTTQWNAELGFNVTALDTDAWWAACDDCAKLINERKIGALRNRAIAGGEQAAGRVLSSWERQVVIDQLSAFWRASPGSPVEASTFQAD